MPNQTGKWFIYSMALSPIELEGDNSMLSPIDVRLIRALQGSCMSGIKPTSHCSL